MHKVRHAILDQFWPPLPLSHISGPRKVHHTCRNTPIFSSTCIRTHVFTGRYVLVRGVFVWKVFVWGGFCLSPFLSEYIRYNRKLNITFNFRCRTYEKNLKSVTSRALGPPLPLSQTVNLLGPPPPRAWRALWTAPNDDNDDDDVDGDDDDDFSIDELDSSNIMCSIKEWSQVRPIS